MSASTENPIVDAIRAGTAPEHVRAAAARGALPIPRATLVQLFVRLLKDETETIRNDAQNSLDALGTEEITDALGDEACPAEALLFFSKRAAREEALAEHIAFHANTPVTALTVLAAKGNTAVVDLVLTNEERLLRQPGLLEKMMLNPALAQNQRGRLLELLDRAAKIAAATETESDPTDDSVEEAEQESAEEIALLLDLDVGELLSASEILGAEELESSDDPVIRDAFQRIVRLNAAQKAVLALKGGREERRILVHDTNKVVSMGVIRNPRINEDEVERIAQMRNVSDDVLRLVGTTREWVKSYAVIHSLVRNPRTPQGISMNFISRLQNKDLKHLLASRDVPALIRRMAKKTFEQRTQRAKGPGKKI